MCSSQLLISPPGTDLDKDEETNFVEATIKTGGYGITDVAWRNDKEIWAVGGSNTIYSSIDGGKSFVFDKVSREGMFLVMQRRVLILLFVIYSLYSSQSATKIPGNLYNVKFFDEYKTGWALGSNGVLLRYTG